MVFKHFQLTFYLFIVLFVINMTTRSEGAPTLPKKCKYIVMFFCFFFFRTTLQLNKNGSSTLTLKSGASCNLISGHWRSYKILIGRGPKRKYLMTLAWRRFRWRNNDDVTEM